MLPWRSSFFIHAECGHQIYKNPRRKFQGEKVNMVLALMSGSKERSLRGEGPMYRICCWECLCFRQLLDKQDRTLVVWIKDSVVLVELQCALSRFSALEILGMVILGSLALQTLDCFRQKKKKCLERWLVQQEWMIIALGILKGKFFNAQQFATKGKSLRLLMRWLVALWYTVQIWDLGTSFLPDLYLSCTSIT